jgi:hypothetical protein
MKAEHEAPIFGAAQRVENEANSTCGEPHDAHETTTMASDGTRRARVVVENISVVLERQLGEDQPNSLFNRCHSVKEDAKVD